MVRSIKQVLYKILHEVKPSDEVLSCLFTEAENTVNSRPLTYIPISHENEESLTPNHFLRGSSNNVYEPGNFSEDDMFCSQKQWRIVQALQNRFWKRWILEYLPNLTKRTKWFTKTKDIEINDIVIICDDNAPRNTWSKGIVVDIFKSQDGTPRSALVKTTKGSFKRSVHKLAILEVRDSTVEASEII